MYVFDPADLVTFSEANFMNVFSDKVLCFPLIQEKLELWKSLERGLGFLVSICKLLTTTVDP